MVIMPETLLIVDTHSVKQALPEQAIQHKSHFHAIRAEEAKEALNMIRDGHAPPPQAVLIDTAQPGEGLDLIRAVRALKPLMPIVVLTKYGDNEYAMQAMQAGASDFLVKPVELDRLLLSLQQALKFQRMSQYILWLERRVAGHIDLGDLVGKAPPFREALAQASEAAACKKPVWLAGPEGTGKAMFARAIHGSSDRAGKPFVAVNCQMLPSHLVESILFGQDSRNPESGVHFTLGKVREADQGTLLLASAEALPHEIQRRLAGILNTGEVTPQGGAQPAPVNIRLIFTTHLPLESSNILSALYQRAQRIVITLPPLDARRDDIIPLAEHFLAMHSASENKYIRGFTPNAREWLRMHSWPGNVHQLSTVVWQAIVFCRSSILDREDLERVQNPSRNVTPAVAVPARPEGIRTLKSIQAEAIRYALEHTGGCMTQAARSLGIGRSTLYRKVSEFDLGNYISRANQTTRPMMNVSSADRS